MGKILTTLKIIHVLLNGFCFFGAIFCALVALISMVSLLYFLIEQEWWYASQVFMVGGLSSSALLMGVKS